MPKHYKVWLELEACDEDNDDYDDPEWPICLAEFDTFPEAHRFLRAMATLHQPEVNDDFAYPLEKFDEESDQ